MVLAVSALPYRPVDVCIRLKPLQMKCVNTVCVNHSITGGPIVVGKVSYCSQVPWIMPASLRDNVAFQRPMQPAQYNAVIDACALNQDLAELPAGDLTELGERGVNLSGKPCWWCLYHPSPSGSACICRKLLVACSRAC
jgi:hypothetical protein